MKYLYCRTVRVTILYNTHTQLLIFELTRLYQTQTTHVLSYDPKIGMNIHIRGKIDEGYYGCTDLPDDEKHIFHIEVEREWQNNICKLLWWWAVCICIYFALSLSVLCLVSGLSFVWVFSPSIFRLFILHSFSLYAFFSYICCFKTMVYLKMGKICISVFACT